MYGRSAMIYDAIYRAQGKDYALESEKICTLIRQYKRSKGNTLLDVACGTGSHIAHLKDQFRVQGLDNSKEMLAIARNKFPEVTFHLADMAGFHLGQTFDVITCLFSAIGYAVTLPGLARALRTFSSHLELGGVAIIEPWFGPGTLQNGKVHAAFVDEPELKVARMNASRIEGRLSYLDFHYMVGTPEGVHEFRETHTLGIFSDEEYQQAFCEAGLQAFRDEAGLDGRGLYIGLK